MLELKLPLEKKKADKVNPETMVIFSQPKAGKTTIVSQLPDSLILDLEGGTHFVDAVKVDILAEAAEHEVLPIAMLKKYMNLIKEANEKKGGYVYKYLVIDTVTALEEIVLPLANRMYKNTSMGKNWVGDDVTTLPKGAGYKYTRDALSKVINELSGLCETLIILGHVKDKLVEIQGKEMPERGLALTGKSSSILCSQVDAVGYLYRKNGETIINFDHSPNLAAGSRAANLSGREIVVAKQDPDTKEIKVSWKEIFVNK